MFTRRQFLFAMGALASSSVLAACQPRSAPTSALPTSPPALIPTLEPSPSSSTATSAAAPVAPTAATAPLIATRTVPPTPSQAYLVVARGSDPGAITRAAVDALGGMDRFVKGGDDVIVKPNICNASYGPEYASTTNPQVVAALVSLCLEAGAARVRVMDLPFSGTAVEAYRVSGIRAAVESAGGQMEVMSQAKYADVKFPGSARDLKSWKVYQDILKADVLINVPIAKNHEVATLTLAMKNLMGVVLNRSSLHLALHQRIADLNTLIKPTLNVIDGVRVLTKNGPTGGSLDYVMQANTIIASHDIVAVDAYATQLLFKKKPEQIGYIRIGSEMGLGRTDLENLKVTEVSI
jgi:uncharacterized protein (DUF362 family)